MKALGLIAVLLCVPFVCIAVETSYYPDRSADVIITPKNIQDDSVIYFSEKFTSTQNQIEETSFADYISHLMGGPVINKNSDRDILPGGSIFDKSPANLLFVVDSVGSDALSHYETIFGSSLKSIDAAHKMTMTRVAYPQDSVASLATLATGNTPSVHGIVNKQWRSERGSPVVAYKAQALPTVASVFDIISQVFEGRSLVVSASADFQMSSALSLHQYLHAENQLWNKLGFFYNFETSQVESLYPGSFPSSLRMSATDLLSKAFERKFTLANPHDKIRFVPETFEFLVDMASGNVECLFDLKKKHDFLFFAEIEFAYAVLSELKSNFLSLVNDDAPDMISFVFSSLKGIQTRYGKNSPQSMAAMAILDSVLVDLISQYNELYHNKVSSQVVFLGSSAFTSLHNIPSLREAVYATVRSSVTRDSFLAYFPSIYSTADNLCERVQHTLEDFAEMRLEVVCPHDEPLQLRDIKFVRASNASNNTNNTNDGYPESTAFHIVLWFSIILCLVLAATVYSLCYMDVGADTSLYRQPNPKFHAQ